MPTHLEGRKKDEAEVSLVSLADMSYLSHEKNWSMEETIITFTAAISVTSRIASSTSS